MFFDIKVDATEPWTGRIVVGVFGDALPITTFNFVNLAKGFKHREVATVTRDDIVKNAFFDSRNCGHTKTVKYIVSCRIS